MWEKASYALVFFIGACILVIGIATSIYVDSVIQGLQDALNNPNLSQANIDRFGGMLTWWTSAKITLYRPIAYLLAIIGLVIIVFSVSFSALTIWHEKH